jgi:hypothetical protein
MIFGRFDDRIHAIHSPIQHSVSAKEGGGAEKDRPLREQIPATGAGS